MQGRKAMFLVVVSAGVLGTTASYPWAHEQSVKAPAVEEIARTAPVLGVEIFPTRIVQGDPVLVKVARAPSSVRITLHNESVPTFQYGGNTLALIGIALDAEIGTSTLHISYASTTVAQEFFVNARAKPTAPLGIPEKLGGNTKASAEHLINTLAEENATLLNLKTKNQALWSEGFGYPLENPIVTDEYGYTRSTVGHTISHKGTDFRAREGTPIRAMNDGEVRLVEDFRNYGKTVVIDHGLGIMTFYMHLSETHVVQGASVKKGESIGLSGQTGYAEAPHLHLTVRINNVSIDPLVFLTLL
jgi:murein DD-endopeptidase MepM/ murein hydrolase activator NlpD